MSGATPRDAEAAKGNEAGERARAEFRALLEEKGHAVEIARRAVERLEIAFADGSLQPSARLESMLRDLRAALERGENGKVGGKSAEAARFILRAISRALDEP